MAHRLSQGRELLPRSAAWYLKEQATFSDVLAYVRRALWAARYFNHSAREDEAVVFEPQAWERLLDQLAATA